MKGDISLKKSKNKFFIEKDGIFCHGTIIFLALSCVFCLIGSIGKWNDDFFVISQVALPVVCSLVFALFLMFFGKKLLWLTCLPAVFSLAFFVIRAFEYNSLTYTVISIVLSVVAVFLYSSVSFGWIRKKWLLILALTVGFFYHLYVKDYCTLKLLNPTDSVSFTDVMQELSILFMILAALSAAFAMKNKISIEDMNLPKMKTPKVKVNNDVKPAEADSAAQEEKDILPKPEEKKALPADTAAGNGEESAGGEEKTEIAESQKAESAADTEQTETVSNIPDTASDKISEDKAANESKDDTGAVL